MLERWKVDVVAYGPSLHDADSYYLMRAYPSVEPRQRSEDAFYGLFSTGADPKRGHAPFCSVRTSLEPGTSAPPSHL